MGIKHIVLITTGQPSVNPRIVKEAEAFRAAGYTVTLLYCFWINWAIAADHSLLKNVKWQHQLIGGSPVSQKILYALKRLRWKIYRQLNKTFGNKVNFAERAQARCYDELLKAAIAIKADWYIGHNLGALPVAIKAAQHHHTKCGFDFEDYHREEVENITPHDLKRILYLENKYVPALNYITAASPLIADKVHKNFPALRKKDLITILNCFPLSQQPVFRLKAVRDDTLQLFWFSQTIGLNRGLEIVFKALEELKDPSIHLTLAGRLNSDVITYIEKHAPAVKQAIHFAGVIDPDQLPSFASQFDVGLALELAIPNNRNICLTNKIFTCLLAGNAIIFSETAAQKSFNEQHKAGLSFESNNIPQLKAAITAYKNEAILLQQRKANYQLANELLNWEKEKGKLLSIIENN